MDLGEFRLHYDVGTIDAASMHNDPTEQWRLWFEAAVDNDVFEPSISQESFGDRTVKSTWPKGDQWNRSIFFQRKVGRSKPPKPVVAQNRVGVFHILGQYLDDGQVQLAGSEPCPYNAAQPNAGMDAHATVLGAEAANDVCNLIDLRLIVAPQTHGAGQLA